MHVFGEMITDSEWCDAPNRGQTGGRANGGQGESMMPHSLKVHGGASGTENGTTIPCTPPAFVLEIQNN